MEALSPAADPPAEEAQAGAAKSSPSYILDVHRRSSRTGGRSSMEKKPSRLKFYLAAIIVLVAINVIFITRNFQRAKRPAASRTASPAPGAPSPGAPSAAGDYPLLASDVVFGLGAFDGESSFKLTQEQKTALIPLLKRYTINEVDQRSLMDRLIKALDEKQRKAAAAEDYMKVARELGNPIEKANQLLNLLEGKTTGQAPLFVTTVWAQEAAAPSPAAASPAKSAAPPAQVQSPAQSVAPVPASPTPAKSVAPPSPGQSPALPPTGEGAPAPPAPPPPPIPPKTARESSSLNVMPLDAFLGILHVKLSKDRAFFTEPQKKTFVTGVKEALKLLEEKAKIAAELQGVLTKEQIAAIRSAGTDQVIKALQNKNLPTAPYDLAPIVIKELEAK